MIYSKLKKFLLGTPLATSQISHEKLPKWKALAVFSSDALSSVAYATQEMLIPLALVSISATAWSLPIAIAIVTLLILVSTSYWQTIKCYPKGGGSYNVTKENLGMYPGLVSGAALLIDYVLTSAVSISAGVEAIASAFPSLLPFQVVLGCLALMIVTLINLRGVRESGSIFAFPTYFFIFSIMTLIVVGYYRIWTGSLEMKAGVLHETYPALSLFLVLKAFSSGCAALTGIEAISDGVMAFKENASRNAQITLIWMVMILGSFFLGITALTHAFVLIPDPHETIVSQLAKTVFNDSFFYYCVQISTAMILFLAANTAFADFPRVCSFLANDRFLPRQLASLGDRLVFSKGIFLLGASAIVLLIIFQGRTHNLIPLYAVGVFLSFTLSQSGMVIHHLRAKEKGWRLSLLFSAMGAITTFVVLIVIGASKFKDGAWMVVILIPTLVFWFRATREHYRRVAVQLAISEDFHLNKVPKHVVVLPISGLHKGVIEAIKYAKSVSSDVRVVYVELDAQATERLRQMWEKLQVDLKLIILPSPYRSVVRPIIDYVRSVDIEDPDDIVTVVIPEFVTARWWEGIYHNQTAFLIRTGLLFERGKVVTSVRYFLSR